MTKEDLQAIRELIESGSPLGPTLAAELLQEVTNANARAGHAELRAVFAEAALHALRAERGTGG